MFGFDHLVQRGGRFSKFLISFLSTETQNSFMFYSNRQHIVRFINNMSNEKTTNCSETVIREGSAEISGKGHVFYNPVQELNRDLSICVLSTFRQTQNQDIKILEALSATGLRSIRYAKDVEGIERIIANDISKSAVEKIQQNIARNQVDSIVEPNEDDAARLMYMSKKTFHVIDIDPYGCPGPFLDAAVQSVCDGGLLLVTATDVAILAGNSPETCYVKYGSVSLKIKCCHEMALRILLRSIESAANKYRRYIIPLLSISVDFYIRVFVRINTSQLECKKSSSKHSMVYLCAGCDAYTLSPLGILKPNPTENKPDQIKYSLPMSPPVDTKCRHCGHRHFVGGPIWNDRLHDPDFVDRLLKTVSSEKYSTLTNNKRIFGILSVIQEELIDVPLYYTMDKLCAILKLEMVPILKFRSALLHANYRVSFSHACESSIKTDATIDVIFDILRCWSKRKPVKPERLIEGTPLFAILSKEPNIEYNFDDIHPEANPKSRQKGLLRYAENPTAYWGPGTRSTLMVGEGKMLKSFRNQNKKKKTRPNVEEVTTNKKAKNEVE